MLSKQRQNSQTAAVVGPLTELKKVWQQAQTPAAGRAALESVGKLLEQCEEFMITNDLYPEQISQSDTYMLLLIREILEIGAQYSLSTENMADFESYFARLRIYYFDYKKLIEPSPYMYEMLALHLMHLITQNQHKEFLLELELIPRDQLVNNIYLQHVLLTYECLVQGRYHKVLVLKDTQPSQNFAIFAQSIIKSIRKDILNSLPTCYSTIKVEDAARLLFFTNISDFEQFANSQSVDLASLISPSDKNLIQFPATCRREQFDKPDAEKIITELVDYSKHFEFSL